jgi:hypothetical protein
MKTTRTLALAALAALSLGVGSAMAQDGGQAYPDYWTRPNGAPLPVPAVRDGVAVQSGSSDVDTSTGADHSATFILQHNLAGAGGVAG